MEQGTKKDIIQRRTDLSSNLLGFCRYLRQHGFTIGPAEISLMLEALDQIAPFETPEAFKESLAATLCRSRRQQEIFGELYDTYWKELEKAVNSKRIDHPEEKPQPTQSNKPSIQQIKDWLYGNKEEDITETATYSPAQTLTKKDFADFTPAEMSDLWRVLQQIARTMALQANRRWQKTHRHQQMDLKNTVRQNLRRGGELMDLRFRQPKKNRHKIVLICDVSKSMDLYSQFLLQFIYTFQNVNKKIESFIFSTSLQRVTHALKGYQFKESLSHLSEEVNTWSGGTRIGFSLNQFIEQYSRLLNRRTTVIILSDGWDTGEVDVLEKSMRKISSKAGRVIWLNPLAGNPDFKPEVEGMKAAMPYIDLFTSGHNIESLRALAKKLR
jgi:uncharacterized protein with von Willebrand factor type A (vWA) domain